MTSKSDMPLLGHLHELRKRLIRASLIVIAGISVSLLFSAEIFSLLQAPLLRLLPAGSHFVALSLLEGWSVYFSIATLFGIILTAPFWLYEFWAFLAPGLIKKERRFLILVALLSFLCFFCGAFFCYFVMMPAGFAYFTGMLEGTGVAFLPQMQLYVSLALKMMLAFGLTFELPLLLYFLVRWEIVELATLRLHRRHMIVVAFIFSAIITPPDVISQIMMAIPFIALYEVGLLAAWIGCRKKIPNEVFCTGRQCRNKFSS